MIHSIFQMIHSIFQMIQCAGGPGRADLKFQNFLYPMESSSGIISLYRSR